MPNAAPQSQCRVLHTRAHTNARARTHTTEHLNVRHRVCAQLRIEPTRSDWLQLAPNRAELIRVAPTRSDSPRNLFAPLHVCTCAARASGCTSLPRMHARAHTRTRTPLNTSNHLNVRQRATASAARCAPPRPHQRARAHACDVCTPAAAARMVCVRAYEFAHVAQWCACALLSTAARPDQWSRAHPSPGGLPARALPRRARSESMLGLSL
jgi:hypothetical protein